MSKQKSIAIEMEGETKFKFYIDGNKVWDLIGYKDSRRRMEEFCNQYRGSDSDECISLMRKKGLHRYEYRDMWDRKIVIKKLY